MTAPRRVSRFDWQLALRDDRDLSSTVKLVGLMASMHADQHGGRVFPGVAHLADECSLGERSTRAALTTLREAGWLLRERKGSNLGRQAVADVYRLMLPAGTPAPRPGDREGTPASDATDPGGTPASGAGTPASDDRNTGTTCQVRGQEGIKREGSPTPNPRHCPRHAYDEHVEEACFACGQARKAHEAAQGIARRPKPLPDLCGQCDNRWIETPNGSAHCPRCHPSTARRRAH